MCSLFFSMLFVLQCLQFHMFCLYNNLSTSLGTVIKSLNTAQNCTVKLST